MVYFWSKYNNIRMDFSDFSEFIGPIIFGLIAWLSNYFGKKKKQPKDVLDTDKKLNENKESFKTIFDNLIPEKEFISKSEENIIEDKSPILNHPDELIKDYKINNVDPVEDLSIEKEEIKYPKIKNKKTIREKLKSRDSLKDAIIIKEILDRKY